MYIIVVIFDIIVQKYMFFYKRRAGSDICGPAYEKETSLIQHPVQFLSPRQYKTAVFYDRYPAAVPFHRCDLSQLLIRNGNIRMASEVGFARIDPS